MRVNNWYNWTRTKKRFAGVSMIAGILMSLSIENNSLWWGVAGIVLCGASVFTVTTIQDHEW